MAVPFNEDGFAQLSTELTSARAQILRLASEQQALRAAVAAEIAASEERTNNLLAKLGRAEASSAERFDLIDFKSVKPDNFRGLRTESWKVWSRQFKTYCNMRREGFRKALDWAETFQGDIINDTTIDEMSPPWPAARLADAKLYDFLLLTCKDDALVLVEHYHGLGFEAWRQLHRRYNPSGGQYELDMMARLMSPQKATKLADLPGAIM